MILKSIKRYWQIRTGRLETPVDGAGPFWIVSAAFHVLLIALLARFILDANEDKMVVLQAEAPLEEIIEEQEDVSLELNFDELEVAELGDDGRLGELVTEVAAPTVDVMTEESLNIDENVSEYGELFSQENFLDTTAATLAPVQVKGTVGTGTSSATGAVDRLTQEILFSLEERATTVVWVFDQSASLIQQREEIIQRFDRIYRELGLIDEQGHKAFKDKGDSPLLTQVIAFGADYSVLGEPTDDVDSVKASIGEIETDTSGIENVMTAVIKTVNLRKADRDIDRLTREPKRNVKIIVVTDEAGDDVQRIGEAIRVCNAVQIPIYVIGVPAPFGRPETLVKWVDPDPEFDQRPQWATVSQGPESIVGERLHLDFVGNFRELDLIDSGFGPFHLTRLCYETGGIYFAVHPSRTKPGRRVPSRNTRNYSSHLTYFFDPDIMRRYKPDYVSNQRYFEDLQKFPCRSALVEAANYTTTGDLSSPRLRFVKTNEAAFVNQVTRAQRNAALIEPPLNRLYEMLRAGESGRELEESPRWQAGYDLAMGRAIAAKLRAETYNGMLALIKTQKKFSPAVGDRPQNNTWILHPANATETGSQHRKLLEKAKAYLERVVDKHPGTPWALLAERELAIPIGWEWTEFYTAPPPEREVRPNNNNNVQRRRPMPRQNKTPKPMRKPPRL